MIEDRTEEIRRRWQDEPSDSQARIDVRWLLEELATIRFQMEDVERKARRTERQSDERAARAWDKGYGIGLHDGSYHERWMMSSTSRGPKTRRNPYRFGESEGCNCHGGGQ